MWYCTCQGGYVMLGQRPVPEAVLHGRSLRTLTDTHQQEGPIEGAQHMK